MADEIKGTDLLHYVSQIKAMSNTFKAIQDLSSVLERIGSIEQAESEAEGRLAQKLEEESEVDARLAEQAEHKLRLEEAISSAEAFANAKVDEATRQAKEIVENAKRQAQQAEQQAHIAIGAVEARATEMKAEAETKMQQAKTAAEEIGAVLERKKAELSEVEIAITKGKKWLAKFTNLRGQFSDDD